MLIDTMAVVMLIQSSLFPIIILVVIEMIFSTLVIYINKGKKETWRQKIYPLAQNV